MCDKNAAKEPVDDEGSGYERASLRIQGQVTTPERRPLVGVLVSLEGEEAAVTDGFGFFDVSLRKAQDRVVLSFAKEGHVTNTKVFNSRASGLQPVRLAPVGHIVTVDPTSDTEFNLGGTTIQIPAGALVASTGSAAEKECQLHFTSFDVSTARGRASAPGEFAAEDEEGNPVRLNSFALFDLRILDRSGLDMGLAEGATIGIQVAVSEVLRERAPATIGFYDFSAVSALWALVDTFEFAAETTTYNGTLTRFGGPQNCDDPQETTCVMLNAVMTWNTMPVAGITVVADGPGYTSSGLTDPNGRVCLLVERNATFKVNAFGGIGSSVMSNPPDQVFTSSNVVSNAADCGDPVRCPHVGTVLLDLVVGTYP